MASSDTNSSQLQLVLISFCQILDEIVVTSDSATSSIRDMLRYLSFVLHSTIGTEEWASMLNCNVRSCALAFSQFFEEEIHLSGDLQSQIAHLQDHPRLLSNAEHNGWNKLERRLELPILCLKLLQALVRFHSKTITGKDVSHLAKTILLLYENTSNLSQTLQKIAMKHNKLSSSDGRDIAITHDSSDSSNADSDSSEDDEWVQPPTGPTLTLLGRKEVTPPSTVASEKEASMIPDQANQMILHRTQAVTFFPTVFYMQASGNCPAFMVRTVKLVHDKMDEAQLFEENVSIASTWYFTVTITNQIPGDKAWRSVGFLVEPGMSECQQAAIEIPENVRMMLTITTSTLTNRDPHGVFVWSHHSIVSIDSKFRAIIKRSLVPVENPQQAYKIMSELNYQSISTPPGFRGSLKSQINTPSLKPKFKGRIQRAMVQMEDIYRVPKIEGNVMEALMKTYVRCGGSDTSLA